MHATSTAPFPAHVYATYATQLNVYTSDTTQVRNARSDATKYARKYVTHATVATRSVALHYSMKNNWTITVINTTHASLQTVLQLDYLKRTIKRLSCDCIEKTKPAKPK